MIEIDHWRRPVDAEIAGDHGVENLFTVEDTDVPVGAWRLQEFPDGCVAELRIYDKSNLRTTLKAMAIAGQHIFGDYVVNDADYPCVFIIVYNEKLYRVMQPLLYDFAFEETDRTHNGFRIVAVIPLRTVVKKAA